MSAPSLSALQVAWLQELGLDKRMLARFVTDAEPFAAAASVQPSVAQAQPGIEPAQPSGGGLEAAPVAAALAKLGIVVGTLQPATPDISKGAVAQSDNATRPASSDMPDTEEALRSYMSDCADCDLHTARSQVVFGNGHSDAPDWMVVGEAPGTRDDKEGMPFQGKAGQLLQAMLISIGIDKDAPVFFTNIVKCRPLGNRPPTREEIAACLPYLRQQIAIVRPARILVLGKLAAQVVLGREEELDALRGQVHHIGSAHETEVPVVVTYHPASLLMRPQHKVDAWHDLNLARSLS